MKTVTRSAALAAACAILLAPGASSAGGGQTLRFHTVKVTDPLSNGIEAFRMLVPDGWVRQGGVVWNLNFSNLASVVMRVGSPRTHEALESFPLYPQVWEQGSYLGPEGANYLGMQVRQPVGAIAMLERLVLPAVRGNVRWRVVSAARLPRVAKALAAGTQGPVTSSSYDAARVRIAYSTPGRALEEDFYTAVSYTASPMLPGATLWQPQLLYSFAAPKGKLDRESPLLAAIVSSVQPSLKWYAGYQYVFNLWVQGQMASIRAAGALSRSISQGNDAIDKATSDAWAEQQASYDRVYGEISNQIRGVESYDDPYSGRTVELPNDYSYAWVSSSGDYALSDSAGFDPNVGSTLTWKPLKVAR
jgi:hypothetical protein